MYRRTLLTRNLVRLLSVVLPLLGVSLFATVAAAQRSDQARVRRAPQERDSVVAHRDAMRAQARFEQIRRHNLPIRSLESPRPCDAHIGRFCQWNSEDDTIPEKEPRVIRRARASLLRSLDSAAARSPRDGWITGQRVRYLLEAGNDSGAVAVALSCIGTRWWCDALRGLTLHETGAGASADSAFARALAAMPQDERCRWTDMTPLLDPSHRKRYGKVGCGKNEEIAQRLWWLADPFLSIAGNDRQAEHYARHTMARILAPARNTYNISWANDLRDMIVRYGWARYWTRGPGTTMDANAGPISGHEATPNYRFIPVSAALDSMHAIAFDLDQERSPERYAPVAANRLTDIDPQVALFRRGDSVQVVAAFDVSRVRPFDSAVVTSSLVLAADESTPSVLSGQTQKGAFTETIDSRPHLMSLEVVSFDKKRAAWKRAGVWLPAMSSGEVDISDVLLFEPSGTEVTDLSQALPGALPGYSIKRGKIGVYWELYGLAQADSALPVSLTLTPVGRSTLRRIGESIGLAPRMSGLNIAWRDTPGSGMISTRSVVLDLSLIPRGKYQLRVEARPSGRPATQASRTIEIQ